MYVRTFYYCAAFSCWYPNIHDDQNQHPTLETQCTSVLLHKGTYYTIPHLEFVVKTTRITVQSYSMLVRTYVCMQK